MPIHTQHRPLPIPSSPDGTLLVAILSNPPLTDGSRSIARVEVASRLLGFSRFRIVNLLGVPTRSADDVAEAGADGRAWVAARVPILEALDIADCALLAYGIQPPGAPARAHFRSQIDWLRGELRARRVPAWTLGGLPRHPSRWQRWTSRVQPGTPFETALRDGLLLSSQLLPNS